MMTWLRVLALIIVVFPAPFLLVENWYFIFPIIITLLAIFKQSQRLSLIALFLLISSFCLFSYTHSSEIRSVLSHDPGKNYATDMRAYLKTLYLMNEGTSFYPAISDGFHLQQSALPPDIWGWKQPFLFYYWHSVGAPQNIWYLGLMTFSSFLITGYLINKKYLGSYLALLGPLLALPYFLYPMTTLTLLLVEWWAISFFMIGICLRVYNHKIAAMLLLFLTLAIRESFIVPVAGFLLYDIFSLIKNKDYRTIINYFLIALIFTLYYFGIHLQSLTTLGEKTTARVFNPGSISFFNLPLAFVSWNYLLGAKRLFLFILIIGVIAALLKIKRIPFVVLAFLPLAAFVLLSSVIGVLTPWHDYWGILFMPTLLILLPTLILPQRDSDK